MTLSQVLTLMILQFVSEVVLDVLDLIYSVYPSYNSAYEKSPEGPVSHVQHFFAYKSSSIAVPYKNFRPAFWDTE